MNEVQSGSLVETLRTKTEKDDLKKNLKSTLGGYTKSSVQEYLGALRRQQQASAEIFTQNQQVLFDEKEKLRQENETLRTLLSRAEAEYKNLSEAIRTAEGADCGTVSSALGPAEGSNVQVIDFGKAQVAVQELMDLRKRCAALEEELKRVSVDNSKLENTIKLQTDAMESDALKREEAGREILSLKEILRAERLESKKMRSEVARLSGVISQKTEEIAFLRRTMSESELVDLRSRISSLTQQLTAQTQVAASLGSENELKAKTIQTLTGENDSLKQNMEGLNRALEDLQGKTDCLRLANNYLTDQLESEYKRTISLIMEKSGTAVDKLAADRKLDEANTKIMMLELKLRDLEGTAATTIVYADERKTDEFVASLRDA